MKLAYHEQRSLEMYGDKYTEANMRIDFWFRQFGEFHRHMLHHRKGILLLNTEIPGPVKPALELHVIDDIGRIPEDWAVSDGMELDFSDYWLSKKTKFKRGALIQAIRDLYPDDAHLIPGPKDIRKLHY